MVVGGQITVHIKKIHYYPCSKNNEFLQQQCLLINTSITNAPTGSQSQGWVLDTSTHKAFGMPRGWGVVASSKSKCAQRRAHTTAAASRHLGHRPTTYFSHTTVSFCRHILLALHTCLSNTEKCLRKDLTKPQEALVWQQKDELKPLVLLLRNQVGKKVKICCFIIL